MAKKQKTNTAKENLQGLKSDDVDKILEKLCLPKLVRFSKLDCVASDSSKINFETHSR